MSYTISISINKRVFGRRGKSLIGGSYRRQSADCICQSKTKKFGCEMNLNRPTRRRPPPYLGEVLCDSNSFLFRKALLYEFFLSRAGREHLLQALLFFRFWKRVYQFLAAIPLISTLTNRRILISWHQNGWVVGINNFWTQAS